MEDSVIGINLLFPLNKTAKHNNLLRTRKENHSVFSMVRKLWGFYSKESAVLLDILSSHPPHELPKIQFDSISQDDSWDRVYLNSPPPFRDSLIRNVMTNRFGETNRLRRRDSHSKPVWFSAHDLTGKMMEGPSILPRPCLCPPIPDTSRGGFLWNPRTHRQCLNWI